MKRAIDGTKDVRERIGSAFLIATLTVMVTILLSGCINPFGGKNDSDDRPALGDGGGTVETSTGYGTLILSTGGISASTVAPPSDLKSLVDRYEVALIDPDTVQSDIIIADYTEGSEIPNIPTGTWNVTITGFNASSQPIATGVPTVGNPLTINEGANAITIQLDGLQSGTGTFAYNLDWSVAVGDIGQIEVTLDPYPLAGGDEEVITINNPSGSGSFSTVSSTVVTTDFGAGTLSINDTAMPSGYYYFSIRLWTTGGQSLVFVGDVLRIFDNLTSDGGTITLTPTDITQPPAAPTGLTAAIVNAENQVTLSWTDNSNNEEEFVIYQDGSMITNFPAGTTSVPGITLAAGTPATFEIRARNRRGESTPGSATLLVITMAYPTDPTTILPGGTPGAESWSSPAVTLDWGTFPGATSYNVYFSTNQTEVDSLLGTVRTTGATSGQAATVYNGGALTPGTTYYWTVEAVNVHGTLAYPTRAFTARDAIYVSPTGNDTTGEGSTTAPYATIGYAVGDAGAGETINVAAGTYNEAGISLNQTGLTLSGAGDTTIITDPGTNSTTLSITADGVTVENMQINAPNAATRAAISISGANATVTNNLITESGTSPNGTTLRGIAGLGLGATISGNRFVLADATAPDIGTRFAFNMSSNNDPGTPGIVEANRISFADGGGTSKIGLQPQGNNFLLRNNIIVQEGTISTAVFNGFRVAVGGNTGNYFYHNTVVNTNSSPAAIFATIENGTDTVLTNNIFASLGGGGTQVGIYGSGTTLSEIHANVFFGMTDVAGTLGATVTDLNTNAYAAGNIEINPGLNTAVAITDIGWFGLTGTSPVEVTSGGDSATLPTVGTDLNSNTRQAPVTIGAHEAVQIDKGVPQFLMVGEWLLDNGIWTDSSGNGFDAIVNGAAPVPTMGRLGTNLAAAFDTNQGLEIATNGNALSEFGNGRTFSYWLTEPTTNGRIIGQRYGGGTATWEQDWVTDTLRYSYSGTVVNPLNIGPVFVPGWNHVAIVMDLPTFQIYVNGTLFTTESLVWDYVTTNPIRIGLTGLAGGVFSFDDLRIYNRALAESEITKLAE